MTRERTQDLIVIALVVSVIAHIALMIAVKPQIMTRVFSAGDRHKTHQMIVSDAPALPESVTLGEVQDIEAIKEAPQANAIANAPRLDEIAALDDKSGQVHDAGRQVKLENEMAAIVDEPSPVLSGQLHVDNAVSSFSTPIVDEIKRIDPASVVTKPVLADAELSLFTSPVISVMKNKLSDIAAIEEAVDDVDAVGADAIAPAKTGTEFVPVSSVYDKVDEDIVEAEKTAVRELLNVKSANEMNKAANVVAVSSRQGDWIYFGIKIMPRQSLEVLPKDVVVLLDASGSIGNDRLGSCRKAAKRVLRSCTNTGDRFNLVAFRDKFQYAFQSWQDCNKYGFDYAERWLDKLAAHGRTDVFASIRSVLTLPRDPKRPLIALVITDGEANSGISETANILREFTRLNDGLVSVYMYGVKKSANRELIEVLTHGNRGEGFVFEGMRWNVGEAVDGFCETFRDPVLSDLRIVFASDVQATAYPRVLKNLYKNDVIELTGRIPATSNKIAFSLKGLHGSSAYEGFYQFDLSKTPFDKNLVERWNKEAEIGRKTGL